MKPFPIEWMGQNPLQILLNYGMSTNRQKVPFFFLQGQLANF